jgi:hypothetical protein
MSLKSRAVEIFFNAFIITRRMKFQVSDGVDN